MRACTLYGKKFWHIIYWAIHTTLYRVSCIGCLWTVNAKLYCVFRITNVFFFWHSNNLIARTPTQHLKNMWKHVHIHFSFAQFDSTKLKASGDDQIKPSTSFMCACYRYIHIRCRFWLMKIKTFWFFHLTNFYLIVFNSDWQAISHLLRASSWWTPPINQRRNELTEHWRNVKEAANITKKVFLSLSDFFCFVNLRGGFLFSILVEIYDIFVE